MEKNPDQKPPEEGLKGKSCKGCLYYSSVLKSKSRNPVCVGISRTFPDVPANVMRDSKRKASEDGPNLSDFKYVCVGYSIKLDSKDSGSHDKRLELPFCLGVKMLVDRRTVLTADDGAIRDHHEEDGKVIRQPRPYTPGQFDKEEFFNRLSRNAGVVASGVAKNMQRVGNHIKANVDDILYPYRRRSK